MIDTPPCLYCSKALGPRTCRGPDSPAVRTAAPGRVSSRLVVRDHSREYLSVEVADSVQGWFHVTGHWPRRVRITSGHQGPVIAEAVLPGDEGVLWLADEIAPASSSSARGDYEAPEQQP